MNNKTIFHTAYRFTMKWETEVLVYASDYDEALFKAIDMGAGQVTDGSCPFTIEQVEQ